MTCSFAFIRARVHVQLCHMHAATCLHVRVRVRACMHICGCVRACAYVFVKVHSWLSVYV